MNFAYTTWPWPIEDRSTVLLKHFRWTKSSPVKIARGSGNQLKIALTFTVMTYKMFPMIKPLPSLNHDIPMNHIPRWVSEPST